MITLLRRIRKQLLENKQFAKYLTYALGEIVLVVIGILIALQINNRNETRKEREEEKKLLKELLRDFEANIAELDTVAYYANLSIDKMITAELHIEQDRPYEKKLDTLFGGLDYWDIPYIHLAAYDALKAKGIQSISDDSLKYKIGRVYEQGMKHLLEDAGKWEWSYNQNTTQRFMTKYFRRPKENRVSLAVPIDYEALKKDEEFRNFLSVLIAVREAHVHAMNILSKGMEECLEPLEAEIAK